MSKVGSTNIGNRRLSEEQQIFIVTKLAQYTPPPIIQFQFAELWPDTKLTKQNIYQYRPDGSNSKCLAKKWVILFDKVREAFLKDVSTIPIADKTVRMQQYQNLYDGLVAAGEFGEAAKVLEKAAKEMGGLFTNERKVEHDGTLIVEAPPSMDELRMLLADKLRPAIEAVTTKH